MARNYKQGYYKPKNPGKYWGDVDKIYFRSSWEETFMRFCDLNTKVIRWNSEEIQIPYISMVDNKYHKYFVDFYIEYENKHGRVVKELIEIKPYAQTRPAKAKKSGKSKLYEDVQYARNVSKWQAATKWCAERRIKFRIVTEKNLYR